MKIKLFVLSICIGFSLQSFAQTPDVSSPILTVSDVENFIANYKNIELDFKKLNINFLPDSDFESNYQSLKSVKDVNQSLKKYGYSGIEDFTMKTWAIATSYASVKLDSQGSPEMEQLIKSIEEDVTMTAEQKKQAIQQMEMVMAGMQQAFGSSANKQDIETVKPFVPALEKLLEQAE